MTTFEPLEGAATESTCVAATRDDDATMHPIDAPRLHASEDEAAESAPSRGATGTPGVFAPRRADAAIGIPTLRGASTAGGIASRHIAAMPDATSARNRCTVPAADGTRLYVRDVGSGAPVVFLHSWMLAAPMWQYQVAELARRGHRCILPDRRGHGRSDEPGSGYDLDTLVDDVDRIAGAFGLDQFALVGHSFGCVEAARYASTKGRGRVSRVALLSPTTPLLRRTDDNPLGIDEAAFEFLRELWRRDFAAWIDENAAPFVTPETSPGIVRWISDMMLRTPLDVGIACNETMVAADTRDDLRSLTIPALVVHGDADASAPLALTGLPTANLLPHATLRVYEGAPHGLFVTHRERLNADLAGFLAC